MNSSPYKVPGKIQSWPLFPLWFPSLCRVRISHVNSYNTIMYISHNFNCFRICAVLDTAFQYQSMRIAGYYVCEFMHLFSSHARDDKGAYTKQSHVVLIVNILCYTGSYIFLFIFFRLTPLRMDSSRHKKSG
jgi:hypothetical protein